MFKRISSKILSFLPHILALLFIFAFAAFAWQEPSQAPPQGNAPAPINVSNTDQSKLGGLGLGGGVGQALQWLKNIGGTLHIQNQAGTSNLVIGQDGKVGIGITGPETKLDVVGTLKATGFKMPTDAEAGKVLTSDASGAGTWKTPAPGSSTLVNYGYYNGLAYNCNQGNTYACYTGLNPCPTGWTEANVGHGALGAYYTSTGYRTCFLCQ